jgi:hypothetical protein
VVRVSDTRILSVASVGVIAISNATTTAVTTVTTEMVDLRAIAATWLRVPYSHVCMYGKYVRTYIQETISTHNEIQCDLSFLLSLLQYSNDQISSL